MDASSRYVLVVEDDTDIREAVCEILVEAGFRVRGAEHGAAALTHLRGEDLPCLILLDLHMPVMDGWAFCDEVAKDSALQRIPIVIVSAVAGFDESREACGWVTDRLAKPVDLDRLIDVVSAHC